MKETIQVNDKVIGAGQPCFIIAEIGQAHDGSLGTAHAYIEAVAKAGVDAVKFQTHIADAESSLDEKFRVNTFPQDSTRFEYWKRMEFTKSQWRELALHAEELDLIFLSTPFSMEAIELLTELNVAAWKIGSGETSNLPMLKRLAETGKPILVSTGMSSWKEIDEAIETIEQHKADIALFQCTTSYPCSAESIGLNILAEMRERYKCPVGLSDHSGTIFSSLAAVSMGANLLEVHAVFSRECFGPDVSSSLTTKELSQLVEGVRFIEAALNNPVDKDEEAKKRSDLALLFGKSIYTQNDLASGHVLSEQDISLKKPGTGIPAKKMHEIIGRRLKCDYKANVQLKEIDLDD